MCMSVYSSFSDQNRPFRMVRNSDKFEGQAVSTCILVISLRLPGRPYQNEVTGGELSTLED